VQVGNLIQAFDGGRCHRWSNMPGTSSERMISLLDGRFDIPERLLLAHARGEVLFITGAGISRPAGLPDFGGLVLEVYARLDAATRAALKPVFEASNDGRTISPKGLSEQQLAEIKRFQQRDYDVVLGMLERRMDGPAASTSNVRNAVVEILRDRDTRPAPIHRALIRLSDRGAAVTIVTTNFDLLLEAAARKLGVNVQQYALGGIPRPGKRSAFAGILHIHGALARTPERVSDLILTDQDFGEFYLRRRIVPDFIYDAARLFHLVLVGYSANDAPMRYLLNAVAADVSRFDDLKERFAFVGMRVPFDQVDIEDWRQRGITPIPYCSAHEHAVLTEGLQRWAEFSAINGKRARVDAELKRITRSSRMNSLEADCDWFDHLIRRSAPNERIRMSALISNAGASIDWLDAILEVGREPAG
jgi:NAD-dependent SIR2 family protein deacetylase